MLFLLSIVIVVGAIVVWMNALKKVRNEQNMLFKTTASAAGLTALAFSFVALSQMFTVVSAGNVGVVDFFGTVSDNTLKAGINFVNPFARVIKFSVKTQEIKEVMDVPSKEGMTVQLEISALFHLNPDKAAEVYKSVGENYVEIILQPQFRSVARGVTAGYEAKALYTSRTRNAGSGSLERFRKACRTERSECGVNSFAPHWTSCRIDCFDRSKTPSRAAESADAIRVDERKAGS